MRVKISVRELLEAFALADSGAKAVVRKVSKKETERTPALLTFEARCDRGGSLEIRTHGEFPAAVITASVVVEAIVDEEGVHSCDLEDARAAFGRFKKTAKRGTLVELNSDGTWDRISTKAGNISACIPRDRDSRVEPIADVPVRMAVVSPDAIRSALDMSKGLVPGTDGELFGHVVTFGHGLAAAMDSRYAEFLTIPAVPEDAFPIHVPRQVLSMLMRSSEPAHIADGYASSGVLCARWRLTGNRAHADGLFNGIRRLADGKSAATTIDGDELRQALSSLSAFLTKGDVISLLPNECGVKILRYDVRDNATDLYVKRKVCKAPSEDSKCDVVVEERRELADRAEVFVSAIWPLPHAVALSASRLKRALGDADGIDLCLDRGSGGPVVARVHGDPVVHLMCQCPCPFKGMDAI